MNFRRGFFVFLSFLSIFSIDKIRAHEIPKAMAVLGDSMSEGMLAGYSLEKKPSLATIAKVAWLTSGHDKDERIEVYRKTLARADLSWATGDSSTGIVQSHYLRVKAHNPDIKAANFAISGNESEDLQAQVDRFLAAEDESDTIFDYVMLMIGANDLASSDSEGITPALKYLGNIEAGIRRVLDKDPHRRLLVVGLPDVHTVFEESANLVVYRMWGKDIKCESMRRDVYGNKTIFYPENKEAYEFTRAIVAQYREGLANLIERLQGEYLDAEFKFIREYRKPTNMRKALSIDCFHPSEWGQAELAEITWERGFWPNISDVQFLAWTD